MHLVSQHGTWYAFCYVYDPVRGKRRRVKRTTGVQDDGTRASKTQATLVGDDIERNLEIAPPSAGGPTLTNAFERLVKARVTAGQSTDKTIYCAKRLFEILGAETPLAEITSLDLADYAAKRTAEKRGPATIRRHFAELSRAFAEYDLVCPKKPKLPKNPRKERWLTEDECRKLLAAAPPDRRPILIAYMTTGVRRREVYKTLKLDEKLLRVKGTKTVEADRVLPLTAAAAEAYGEEFQPWANGNRALRKYCRKAGIEPCTFNDLRRTFATQLVRNDVSLKKVAALLGHTTTRMVDEIYAKVKSGEDLRSAVEKLPDFGSTVQVGQQEPQLRTPLPTSTGEKAKDSVSDPSTDDPESRSQ